MNRRSFLMTASAALIAGCSSGNQTEKTATPTPTETPTETETPSPTPAPQPKIDFFSPITQGEEAEGNLSDFATSGFGKGGNAYFGCRAGIPIHDSAADYSAKATILQSGETVDTHTYDAGKKITQKGNTESGEFWVKFGDISDWSRGSYKAEIIVRDDISGETSTETAKFSVNPPFGASEIELISSDIPSTVKVGESFDYTLTFKNKSSRASSIVSPVSARYGSNSWTQTDSIFQLNLAPNSTGVHHATDVTFENAGQLDIRLDAIDTTLSFQIED